VRFAFGNRSACQAAREAAEAREAAPAREAEAERQRHARSGERRRTRTQQRRQKLRAAAELLAEGKTQVEVAHTLGKNVRTIRRWTKLAGFEAELAKARRRRARAAEREQRRAEKRHERNARRHLARRDPHRYALLYGVASGRPAHFQPAAERALTEPRRGSGRVLPVLRW